MDHVRPGDHGPEPHKHTGSDIGARPARVIVNIVTRLHAGGKLIDSEPIALWSIAVRSEHAQLHVAMLNQRIAEGVTRVRRPTIAARRIKRRCNVKYFQMI